MACKDCVYVREPMRGFYNQVYCNYHHIHVSNQPYYDASERCNGYKTKQTNADRIRAMSDLELANWLITTHVCTARFKDEWCKMTRNCQACWLDWLKQESEGE